MSLLIYRSSAGSGKTYTLVKEYLKIVLSDPSRFRSILAITFTNKSANEMKDRVLQYLKHLAFPVEDESVPAIKYLLPTLVKETGLDSETITRRAGEALMLILHNYSDFAVSTIDSFVYRIIRTFAHDFHLPYDFDVEMDTENLISKAIDLLLSRAGNDIDLTRVLVSFIESKASQEDNWQIEGDLKKFTETMFKEDGETYLEKLKSCSIDDFIEISKKLSDVIHSFENSLYSLASGALNLVEEKKIPHSAFYYQNQGLIKYFEYIRRKEFDKLEPNSRVRDTVEDDRWTSNSATKEQQTSIQSIKLQILEAYRKIRSVTEHGYKEYAVFKLLRRNIYPMALLNEIEKVINEMRIRNRFIHISEFNRRIAALVVNEPVPFIYERLGDKFRHFLIDEFQDTSILQWQNLLPLLHNSLSYGNLDMLVGDGKQAIYRWRNGEVEQFARLPEIYQKNNNPVFIEAENFIKSNHTIQHLESNFRSKAELVKFNNDFFSEVKQLLSEDVKDIYDHHEQIFQPENIGGYVQLEFFDKGDTDVKTFEYNCTRVKEIITDLINDEFHLKDIAILCRTNENASEIARYLMGEGIEVISYESLLLKNSPDIRFIITIIKYLLLPDPILGTEIVNYLMINKLIGTDNLASYLSVNLQGADNNVHNHQQFIAFLESQNIKLTPSNLLKLPVYDLNEEIIRLFKIDRQSNPYVQFYLDAVLKFTVRINSGIAGFLEWWDETMDKYSILIPEGADAVKIMTIHKAKGLEFPVVIFPYATEKHKMGKNNVWVELEEKKFPKLKTALLPLNSQLKETEYWQLFVEENDKSMLDLINLLYVVMTRPVNRLYIISIMPPQKVKEVKSLPAIFSYYLGKRNLWNEIQKVYTFGSKVALSQKILRESDNGYSIKRMISGNWTNTILLSMQAPEIWDVTDPERNRKWGNMLHLILSRIASEEDVEKVLSDFFISGLIDNNQKKELKRIMDELIHQPEINAYFKTGLKVRAEAEVLLPSGKSYRPDRIVFNDTETIIMDYKTGKPDEIHKDQIRSYGHILEKMGYRNVIKYLLYIDQPGKVVKVDG